MAGKHKMRLKQEGDGVLVRLLISHPMETGNRKDPVTGQKIPRSFVRELECLRNGKSVMEAQWSWGMARNPYIQLKLGAVAKGDEITFRWADSDGGNESLTEVFS